MARCQSCDGIITKDEEVCYHCGDSVPDYPRSPRSFPPVLIAVALILSLGFATYSFLSGVTY